MTTTNEQPADLEARRPEPDFKMACNCLAKNLPHKSWCEAIRGPLSKGEHGHWCNRRFGGPCARNCNA